ncbi:MAG: glycosyltransferase family 4 protein [Thermosynechococcaceae cyanobacterium]
MADTLKDKKRNWHFFNDKPLNLFEKLFRKPSLAKMRASFQAVQAANRHRADLLFTFDPVMTFWCAVFSRWFGLKIEHIVHALNYPDLPTGVRRYLSQWAFTDVSQINVSSMAEKQIYSEYFDIPAERFQVKLWGIGKPDVQPQEPLVPGDYICAIGGNARDYPTLMAAMKKLPDVQLAIVVRPDNLKNLSVPSNVKVFVNLPMDRAMNILQYSRFMVLPLKGSKIPCGHVTLVAAMHLGKAFVITNSQGVSDYAFHDTNAITCEPFNPDALSVAIRTLWSDPQKCQRLGENGQQFAQQNCSEESSRLQLQQLLLSRNL